MKAVCFSDTHKTPIPFNLPKADFGIFAGDCSLSGQRKELEDFLHWYSSQPVKEKIFVAGNHDWFTYRNENQTRKMMSDYGITYLRDDGIEMHGYKFYGTPIQPFFCNWAWNQSSPEERDKAYNKIPEGIDVLITHCPPFGVLDTVYHYYHIGGTYIEEYVGCPRLLSAVQKKQPKFHVFGHIHCSRGVSQVEGIRTRFVNSAICDEAYDLSNTPMIIDLDNPFNNANLITSDELQNKKKITHFDEDVEHG